MSHQPKGMQCAAQEASQLCWQACWNPRESPEAIGPKDASSKEDQEACKLELTGIVYAWVGQKGLTICTSSETVLIQIVWDAKHVFCVSLVLI